MSPPLSYLAVRIRPLEFGDTVGKAAELLRSSTVAAAPVIVNGHVVGMVTSAELAAALDGNAEEVRRQPVLSIHPRPVFGMPGYWSAEQGLRHLRREGLDAAPVLDATGRYVGMVAVADLASALCGRLRPRSIGGMATPFGVYLTDGNVRGGVGNWALVSAGVFMGALNLVAMLIVGLIAADVVHTAHAPHWLAGIRQFVNDHADVAVLIVFALLFRLTWVAGFHAAEHQTVHAIEAGDDLTPAAVQRHPRVHPRCGTNLVIGLLLIVQLWKYIDSRSFLRDGGELTAIGAVILFVFTWRRLGSAAQHYVTTRPANDVQIRSGIRAGEELLAAYQEKHLQRPSRWLRFWNMGFCQIFAGFSSFLLLLWLVSLVVPIPGIQLLW